MVKGVSKTTLDAMKSHKFDFNVMSDSLYTWFWILDQADVVYYSILKCQKQIASHPEQVFWQTFLIRIKLTAHFSMKPCYPNWK